MYILHAVSISTTHNIQTHGSCPKTGAGEFVAAGRSRRVLFGWQQDGNSDGGAQKNDNMNAMTLPRDISLSPTSGAILQRFIPELQTLRVKNWMQPTGSLDRSKKAVSFPSSGGVAAAVPLPASGAQLEISTTISYGSNATRFGFLVLAGQTGDQQMGGEGRYSEFTVIGFDVVRNQIFVDRSRCGTDLDADVRAGPWPTELVHMEGDKTAPVAGVIGAGKRVSLHMYVDHAIVTLIVNNQTAFSVWAHPSSSKSTGLALWADDSATSVMAETLDIWQLRDPQ